MDGDLRAALFKKSQAMTTQAQAATSQAQAMMAQDNCNVVPHDHKQVGIMAYRIRYFTRMNPPTLYRCKVEEEPQEFIDEVYMILFAIGLSTS